MTMHDPRMPTVEETRHLIFLAQDQLDASRQRLAITEAYLEHCKAYLERTLNAQAAREEVL